MLVVLVAISDPVARRRVGRLLPGSDVDIHWVADVGAAVAAAAERTYDVMIVQASLTGAPAPLLAEDPLARIILVGDPSDDAAVAAARSAGAADHLPSEALDAPTLRRAVRAAADHRRAVSELRHAALHDPLTDLPNRTLARDRLRHALRRRRRGRTGVAVLYLDLDGFKRINDSLGHAAGDDLLRQVAQRIARSVRPSDTVARLAGDEFLVVLEDVCDERAAGLVAERVIAAIAAPVALDGRSITITSSVGVALGAPGDQPDGLLREADIALYRAKAAGRARHAVFDGRMRRAAATRRNRAEALRRALGSGAVELRFAPIVGAASGALVGLQAGWQGDRDTIAEEAGLDAELGGRVLRESARHAHRLGVPVTVAMSGRRLVDPGLPTLVRRALVDSGARPGLLRIAVTEAALAGDEEGGVRALRALLHLGVGAQLDGFGAGLASLRLLQSFPGDAIELAPALASDPAADGLVRAVVGLAHARPLTVIGGGVATAVQLARLRELGCDLAHGPHLGAPVPAAGAGALVGAGGLAAAA